MEEDRISQLPDAILQQILSLIDTNEAAQTAILSRRWKNLCLSLPDLRFHLSRFAALDNHEAARRFSAFVSHFLSHRDGAAPIRSFRLSFDSHRVHADAAFVHQCVLYAVNHGARSLRLHARCRPDLILPEALFASETLRELELRQFRYVIWKPNELSYLQHLKTLSLESTALVNIDDRGCYFCLKEPLSGLPELEKLTIGRSLVYGLIVKAPKLRVLEIIDQEYSYSHMMGEIYAPLLTSFRYEGFLPLVCSKVNLPILEEVHLSIHRRQQQFFSKFDEERMLLNCFRMLQQLGNAKIVALSLDTLKVLEMDGGLIEQSPCPFPYMKCLKIIKRRRKISTVLRRVMNFLTEGILYFESLVVELPRGLNVVEKSYQDLIEDDSDEQQLKLLFGIEEEAS